MVEIICPRCNGKEWIIIEEVSIGQDSVSVECECNTLGCHIKKNIFLDITVRAEDFNNE